MKRVYHAHQPYLFPFKHYNKCNQDYLVEMFSKGHSCCKLCQREYNLKWHAAHSEETKERVRLRQQDPTYIEYHRKYERDRYTHNPRAAEKTKKISYKSIIERDGLLCHICGQVVEREDLSFDHVIPLYWNGTHTEENIKVSHLVCDTRKKAKLIGELTDFDRRGPDK